MLSLPKAPGKSCLFANTNKVAPDSLWNKQKLHLKKRFLWMVSLSPFWCDISSLHNTCMCIDTTYKCQLTINIQNRQHRDCAGIFPRWAQPEIRGKAILPWQGLTTFIMSPATHSVDFLSFKNLIWLDAHTFYAPYHRSTFKTTSVKLDAGFVVHCCVMRHI